MVVVVVDIELVISECRMLSKLSCLMECGFWGDIILILKIDEE